MNFRIIEGHYTDIETIKDDFEQDYLYSDMKNNEIRIKYQLTHKEFRELSMDIKQKHNLSRRPSNNPDYGGRYYYRTKYGFQIRKCINGRSIYLGFVPNESIAKKVVKLCEAWEWDIQSCRNICREWRNYVN